MAKATDNTFTIKGTNLQRRYWKAECSIPNCFWVSFGWISKGNALAAERTHRIIMHRMDDVKTDKV